MQQLPSMWRKELWHPMVVHFPIATLLLAAAIGILLIFKHKGKNGPFLARSLFWLLSIGVATAWIAIYTGLWSYNTEVRRICDPAVLKSHLWWGYCATILYSAGLALYVMRPLTAIRRLLMLCTVLLSLGGAGALLYTGHLGASLVYQLGAGVHQPSSDCAEFGP